MSSFKSRPLFSLIVEVALEDEIIKVNAGVFASKELAHAYYAQEIAAEENGRYELVRTVEYL